jgi:hypothetical protein
MNPESLPEFDKDTLRRFTVWMHPDHKRYIEDLSYTSSCSQRDILFYMLQNYISENKREYIKRKPIDRRKSRLEQGY